MCRIRSISSSAGFSGKNLRRSHLLLCLWGLICLNSFGTVQATLAQQANDWSETGKLPLRYIDTSVHGASPHNWDMIQDDNGILYIANAHGLLIHDGVSWDLVDIPDGVTARSLTLGDDNKIYIGSNGEVGYLNTDSLGNPAFYSVKQLIPDAYHDFTMVWDAVSYNGSVFFLTDKYLFRLKDQSIDALFAEQVFSNILHAGDHLIVSDGPRLLYLTQQGSLEEIPQQGHPLPTQRARISGDAEGVLFFSQEGLLTCSIKAAPSLQCIKLETDIESLIYGGHPYVVQRLPNGHIALGFDGQGLAILDPAGRLIRRFDETAGLMNLEIMNLFVDREGALWLVLYDGLARLEPSGLWSLFGRSEGLPSVVTQVLRWNGTLMVASMLGLYQLSPGVGLHTAQFEKLQDSYLFINCFDLDVINATLVSACTNGLVRIDEQPGAIASATQILEGRYLSAAKDPRSEYVLYTVGDGGLSKVHIEDGNATLQHTEPLAEEIFDMLVEPHTDERSFTRIWAVSHPSTLLRVDVPDDGTPWRSLHIDVTHGLSGELRGIFFLSDTLRVATTKGLFSLSSETPVFEPVPYYDDTEISYIGSDLQENAWVWIEETPHVIQGTPKTLHSLPATHFSSRIGAFRTISTLREDSTGVVWMGHNRGMVRFIPSDPTRIPKKPSVRITHLISLSKDSLLHNGLISDTTGLVVPYDEGSIRFSFAAQVYDMPEHVQYRVMLEGHDEDWQPWMQDHIKEYTNLREGSYTFHVQAQNLAGTRSDVASISLDVLPPWYRTAWAYALWILVGVLIFWITVWQINRYQTRRLLGRNKELDRLVAEQTREIREKNNSLEDAYHEIQLSNTSLAAAYEQAQTINDQLIKSNKSLELRTDQLHDALEENKEILGITAHDLKNPLGGIIGLAEMVIQDMQEGVQETYESASDNLPLLKEEAERMLQIIKDLLDKHREGKATALNIESAILGDVVSAVTRWNAKQAATKAINLHYETSETFVVDIDVMAIQRVLDNYVSNAIKYSPEGSNVWITIKRWGEDTTEGMPHVQISVRDEGPGLTAEDKQKVFGKMQRLSAKPTGGEHSTGLGLYIVKQLVEAHGGCVGVNSIQGQGAVFWFTLPQSNEQATTSHVDPQNAEQLIAERLSELNE